MGVFARIDVMGRVGTIVMVVERERRELSLALILVESEEVEKSYFWNHHWRD